MRMLRSAWLNEADELEDYDEYPVRDVYSDELREDILNNDEISNEEEAFMVGWNEAA